MDKKKFKKIIFWVMVLGFSLVILISLIYSFVHKDEEPEFSFNTCMEKYAFVYNDLCDSNESFYIPYPKKERIKGELPILTIDDYPYFEYWKRCIKHYKIGCGEYHGKI